MGLLLSILVSCVGVVELVTFYSDLCRSLRVSSPNDSDLEVITSNYRRMLIKEYRQMFAEVNGKDTQPKSKTNFALATSPKAIFSSEENKVNAIGTNLERCGNNLKSFQQESNHISHQLNFKNSNCTDVSFKFLPTEIECDSETKSISSEKSSSAFFAQDTNHIYSHEKPEACGISSNIEHIYLQDETYAAHSRSPSPYPTYELLAPRSSICSELLQNPTVTVNEVEEDDYENEDNLSPSTHASRSPSPATKSKHYRRSLSPTRQTNLDYRHRSISPSKNSLEEKVAPFPQKRRRTKSSSDFAKAPAGKDAANDQLVFKDYWRRSPSPFEQLLGSTNDATSQQYVLVQEVFGEDFKNSLDGVKTKDVNEERKREFKRKRNTRNRSSQTSLDEDSGSRENPKSLALKEPSPNVICNKSSSIIEDKNVNNVTSPTSSNDVLENKINLSCDKFNPSDTCLSGVSKDSRQAKTPKPGPSKEEKKPEPFWVN